MEFEKFEEITEKGFDLDNKLKNSTSFSELFNTVDDIEDLYKESDKLLLESESLNSNSNKKSKSSVLYKVVKPVLAASSILTSAIMGSGIAKELSNNTLEDIIFEPMYSNINSDNQQDNNIIIGQVEYVPTNDATRSDTNLIQEQESGNITLQNNKINFKNVYSINSISDPSFSNVFKVPDLNVTKENNLYNVKFNQSEDVYSFWNNGSRFTIDLVTDNFVEFKNRDTGELTRYYEGDNITANNNNFTININDNRVFFEREVNKTFAELSIDSDGGLSTDLHDNSNQNDNSRIVSDDRFSGRFSIGVGQDVTFYEDIKDSNFNIKRNYPNKKGYNHQFEVSYKNMFGDLESHILNYNITEYSSNSDPDNKVNVAIYSDGNNGFQFLKQDRISFELDENFNIIESDDIVNRTIQGENFHNSYGINELINSNNKTNLISKNKIHDTNKPHISINPYNFKENNELEIELRDYESSLKDFNLNIKNSETNNNLYNISKNNFNGNPDQFVIEIPNFEVGEYILEASLTDEKNNIKKIEMPIYKLTNNDNPEISKFIPRYSEGMISSYIKLEEPYHGNLELIIENESNDVVYSKLINFNGNDDDFILEDLELKSGNYSAKILGNEKQDPIIKLTHNQQLDYFFHSEGEVSANREIESLSVSDVYVVDDNNIRVNLTYDGKNYSLYNISPKKNNDNLENLLNNHDFSEINFISEDDIMIKLNHANKEFNTSEFSVHKITDNNYILNKSENIIDLPTEHWNFTERIIWDEYLANNYGHSDKIGEVFDVIHNETHDEDKKVIKAFKDGRVLTSDIDSYSVRSYIPELNLTIEDNEYNYTADPRVEYHKDNLVNNQYNRRFSSIVFEGKEKILDHKNIYVPEKINMTEPSFDVQINETENPVYNQTNETELPENPVYNQTEVKNETEFTNESDLEAVIEKEFIGPTENNETIIYREIENENSYSFKDLAIVGGLASGITGLVGAIYSKLSRKNKDKKEMELANIYDATQEIENNLFDN